ncbi:uncharacterized protein N7482_000817 [Penicillium canariense]|uniref:Uncharacterized protein n=1 Tax=Penicillium canariense TaxID=189055 RepID=A0A9W9IFA4_9EURO|nr:uncharacterized protein N7482_000817 [Penicillium canariense]KAJ5174940.1 hypothetical protein N7482_000817 [Penicillium canariense]
MGNFKDGSMACVKAAMISYTQELKGHKEECARLLTEHEQNTPDMIWKKSDEEGRAPFSAGDSAKYKLVTTVTYENGKPVFPPKFTRLSDELVYLATKFLKMTDRANGYPYDFNDRGDIREDRVPSGLSPIIWAHGLPFFPVFKGYYILCGRKHARWVGWLLHKKQHKTMQACPMWTIGPVVAPGGAVNLARTVNRQMRMHIPKSAKDVDRRWEKAAGARDIVSTAHYQLSVVPRTPSTGFVLMPIYQVEGYHVRCGPNAIDGGKGVEIGRRTLSDHGVTQFDYDASLKKPYSNEENPALYPDGDSECTDSEATELMSDMEEDEDGSFVNNSEESAETGEIVEEPPKKKLKKNLAASVEDGNQRIPRRQTTQYFRSPQISNWNANTPMTFDATTAKKRLMEITTAVGVKCTADDEITSGSMVTRDTKTDSEVKTTAAIISSDTVGNIADSKVAHGETTHFEATSRTDTLLKRDMEIKSAVEDINMVNMREIPTLGTPSPENKAFAGSPRC